MRSKVNIKTHCYVQINGFNNGKKLLCTVKVIDGLACRSHKVIYKGMKISVKKLYAIYGNCTTTNYHRKRRYLK